MLALCIATLATNIAANVVSPANDFAHLAPRKISFRIGGFITGIIGVVMMPWKLVADPTGYIFTWLVGYSALLGPIGGILIADYFVLRRMQLHLAGLYRTDSEYRYTNGFSLIAIFALIVAVLPNLPGFLVTVKLVDPDERARIFRPALRLRLVRRLRDCVCRLSRPAHLEQKIDMKLPELPPFEHKPKKYNGPSADEVLRLRKQFLNPGIFLYYKKPIMFVEGKMQYLWDEHGRRYLDALGGIVTVSVGHCHPHVVDVGEQAKRNAATFHHDLSAPEHRRVRREAGGENAGRPEGLLLRQLRLGSERSRAADGARLHRQLRRHRAAQRVSRRQRADDGTDRASHLEI